ncbi:hypothetical protein Tco_0465101, partial [Tanacetum coccineum]
PDDEEQGTKEMIDAGHVDAEHENINQEGAGNQVKDDAQATQKTEVPIPSSSVSSDYAAKYLNFDNIPLAETEVIFMMDINVQHQVPCTSSLLTIPVSVIPKHNVINPSETITTASVTTISSLLSSLFPFLQQLTPIPTLTTEATTSTTAVPDSETLFALYQRVTDLEKDKDSGSNMHLRKVPKTSDKSRWSMQESSKCLKKTTLFKTTTLEEFDQKTTLFETMTKFKSLNKSPRHRALYHALMESILEDEEATDKAVAEKLKKRKPDDADIDEGQAKSTKDQVDEPIFVQDSNDDTEFDNTDIPMDQGEDLDKTNEQPNDEDVPKNDWYMMSRSDPSPNPEWNKGKSTDDGPEQSWLNDMAKVTKPPLTFDELMHTPIKFSSFNNPEGHRCPYDLTKPLPMQMSSQSRQIVPVDFFFNNKLEYLRGGSNGKKYTASTTKSKALRVKVNEWYVYGHLEEIVVKREDQQLYTFKEGDFKRLHLNDIEDMLLLIVQNKLNNLYGNVIVPLAYSLCMFARRTVI